MSINIAVLVSGHGRGSNLKAIIDACNDGRIDGKVAVVIGVKDDAPAMQRARDNNITAVEVRPKEFASDELATLWQLASACEGRRGKP